MELLTAVNRILPALGEHPVTQVNVKHPTIAILLPILEAKLDETLSRGWWFNEYEYTLYPDSEGLISIPTDTLMFIPTCVDAITRGNRLFNPLTDNYVWTAPVKGVITRRWPFEELPETVATYVFYSALVQAYLTDLGLEATLQAWQQIRDQSEHNATSEHLRNKKHTTRKSARYQRLRAAMRG